MQPSYEGDPVHTHTVTLEPGMVISSEPGIIVPGVAGGHLENMLLVTAGEAEVLTKTPFDDALMG